jgi:diaminohydroxyphosphoribosylaminopyrimidine deaminase/5-amino-6-(5-phosphoribosylamino)uracil reductase
MDNFSARDSQFMALAIQLAALGRYTTSPNPNVGCVIVKQHKVIASGFHLQAGQAHAEIIALAKISAQDANGATVYVTLEPCSHQGRTGSCAQALIAAKVTRVVCAMQDPNPQVAGQGFALLLGAGIKLDAGLMSAQAAALNRGFINRMCHARPWVNVKLAMSIDGRTAMQSGESQWITGPAARSDVQRLRAEACAIITGIGSIEQDDSSLMVRVDELAISERDFDLSLIHQKQPLRVVLDSSNRLSKQAHILNQAGRTLRVIAQPLTEMSDVDLVSLPNNDGQIDLKALLSYLAEKENCNSVLVEAGATLAGGFVENGLFDQLIVYMAPTLLGSSARPLLNMEKNKMSQQQRLKLIDQRFIGDDLRFSYAPELTVRKSDQA